MLEDPRETLRRIVDALKQGVGIEEITDPNLILSSNLNYPDLRQISPPSDPDHLNPPTAIYDSSRWPPDIGYGMASIFADKNEERSDEFPLVEDDEPNWTPECQDEPEARLPPWPRIEKISRAEAWAVLTHKRRQIQGESA